MKTDLESIQEMLRANGVTFETEQGSRLHFGSATLIFDTLGRLSNGGSGPDWDYCPYCAKKQELIDKAISVLED